MSKHRTIYVADDEVWNSIKQAAKAENRSVSNYVVWMHAEQGLMKTDGAGKTEKLIPDNDD